MTRGRPRIRTPEYWQEYRRRRNQENKRRRWHQKVAAWRMEHDCSTCDRAPENNPKAIAAIRVHEEELGYPIDTRLIICERCYRDDDMIGQKPMGER